MSIGTLLIRADASIAIGTGHAMRCLALAQAWQDAGGRAMFAMAEATSAIRERLAAESCPVLTISASCSTAAPLHDALETIAIARNQKSEWIVVDGYNFTEDYQRSLKEAGFKVLFLDDYGHATHYCADVVLNQNVNASEALYASRSPDTQLLLGLRYALLRREFSAARDWKREVSPVARRVLVTMGGSDPENMTGRVVEALSSSGLDIEAAVVIGGSNPNAALQQQTAEGRKTRINVRRDVTNMAELMAWADVAISSAGTTAWELCLLGLPALLIDVAPNQTGLAAELARRGCAIHVGDQTVSAREIAGRLKELVDSQEIRRSLAQRSSQLLDGKGALRVVSALRGADGIRLRPVRSDDIRLLWEWANDAEVRAASFSTARIAWDTHVEWFEKKIRDKECVLFVAEDQNGSALGQIRFDLNGTGAELNLSLAKQSRGLGLAVPLIEAGIRQLQAERHCTQIHAFVKPENAASGRAFERAGFVSSGMEQVRGNAALHFIYDRT